MPKKKSNLPNVRQKQELVKKEEEKQEIVIKDSSVLDKKEVEKKISQLLKEKKRTNNKREIERINDEIKEILISFNETLQYDDSYIHKVQTLEVFNQNEYLDNDNIAFVYFFWSASSMNFKIIGLKTLYPIFEIPNTKEMYYLDKPTMFCNDIPIFWLNKGIPFTLEVQVKKELLQLNQEVFEKGYNADLLRSMVKNHHFLNVYGKERWSIRFISFIFTLITSICLLEYILLYNMWITK